MNSEKKKYFLFPKCHLNNFLFLGYFISSLVNKFILIGIEFANNNLSISIFKLYINEIGDFFSIIPYLIIKKKTKSKIITKSVDSNNNEEKNDFIYNDIKIEIVNKMKKPLIINIFIISLINFFA